MNSGGNPRLEKPWKNDRKTDKYPYFRDEIKEILHNSSDTSGLEKEIERYKKKYNLNDRWEEKKFYNALMRKWFRWEDIKNKSNKTMY